MGHSPSYKLPISVTFDDHFSPDILQVVADAPCCQSLNLNCLRDADETYDRPGSQPHLGRHLLARQLEGPNRATGFAEPAQGIAAARGHEEFPGNVQQGVASTGDQRTSTITELCSRRRL
jgi:hypothetical protein